MRTEVDIYSFSHVSFCLTLESVRQSVVRWKCFTFKSSHLKPLYNIKSKLVDVALGRSPFKWSPTAPLFIQDDLFY